MVREVPASFDETESVALDAVNVCVCPFGSFAVIVTSSTEVPSRFATRNVWPSRREIVFPGRMSSILSVADACSFGEHAQKITADSTIPTAFFINGPNAKLRHAGPVTWTAKRNPKRLPALSPAAGSMCKSSSQSEMSPQTNSLFCPANSAVALNRPPAKTLLANPSLPDCQSRSRAQRRTLKQFHSEDTAKTSNEKDHR